MLQLPISTASLLLLIRPLIQTLLSALHFALDVLEASVACRLGLRVWLLRWVIVASLCLVWVFL